MEQEFLSVRRMMKDARSKGIETASASGRNPVSAIIQQIALLRMLGVSEICAMRKQIAIFRKGEALPGGQRAATLHQDKASNPNTHHHRNMVG